MNFLYLSAGSRLTIHSQCYFSILSVLAHNPDAVIYIYTDYPHFYNGLGDKVKICFILDDQLKQWKGKYDFFLRVKIAILNDFITKNPDTPFIFIDTDTFVFKPMSKIWSVITMPDDHAFLHMKEKRFCEMKHSSKKMWNKMKGKTFAGITLTNDLYMWNSGLIGMPPQKQQEVISHALAMCDELNDAGIRHFLVEQWSISIVLNYHYKLSESYDMLAHYWGYKERWNDLILNFFSDAYMRNLSFEECIQKIKEIDYNQIPILKEKKNIGAQLKSFFTKR